jgi:small subunit ribosomal protein S1
MSSENTQDTSSAIGRQGMTEEYGDDFAALLDKSSMGKRLYPGQKVRAKVVSVSEENVYIDLGGKSDGILDASELLDENGAVRVRQGDEIEAFFVTFEDGLMKMTTLIGGYSALSLNAVRDACEAGIAVSGEVKREIKGGFEVTVGGIRCFCPFSQIGLKGSAEENGYPGQTLSFKVLEYAEDGKKIVLSRRALLEQERQAMLEHLRETLSVGMDINAVVKSIQKFGAFVDIGGMDGLIPLSELSWDRSQNPGEVLSIGEKIRVRVTSLEWEKNRVTLSLKATRPDPWDTVPEKYPVDSRVSGVIVRLAPFGAFVRLEPGIDGLIHISQLGAGRHINHPREVVAEGQLAEVYVLSVDPQNKKLSLSMTPRVAPQKIALPAAGETREGVVEKIMPYGIFLRMDNGLTGLIPHSEMGTPAGTDHKRAFPPGTEMQVVVIDVDTAAHKVRLSRKAFLDKTTQDEYLHYKENLRNSDETPVSNPSLGEMIRAKLDENKKQG